MTENGKKARNAYYRAWYAAHPTKAAEYSRRWREKNPEKAKQTAKVWNQKNAQTIRQYHENYWERKGESYEKH